MQVQNQSPAFGGKIKSLTILKTSSTSGPGIVTGHFGASDMPHAESKQIRPLIHHLKHYLPGKSNVSINEHYSEDTNSLLSRTLRVSFIQGGDYVTSLKDGDNLEDAALKLRRRINCDFAIVKACKKIAEKTTREGAKTATTTPPPTPKGLIVRILERIGL